MFERRQRSCCEKYDDSVLGTNVRQRASRVLAVLDRDAEHRALLQHRLELDENVAAVGGEAAR